jgi:YVTN family beta-propeller protein
VLAPLAGLAACSRLKYPGFPGYAFVANQEGRAVAAVDLTTFAVARYIPLNGGPTAVAAHPVHPAVFALTPDNGTVHEIAAGTLALRSRKQVARSAITMRMDPSGAALWVLCQEPQQLVRLSADSLDIEATIRLPAAPSTFDIAIRGNFCGVGFAREGLAALIDARQGRITQRISTGGETGPVQFRSDARSLMVANRSGRLLSLFDVPSGRVIAHLPLALRPEHFCTKADGGQLFITGEGVDAVVVVYPHKTPQVAATVLAGRAPGAMATSNAGPESELPEYLFVANPVSGHVSVLNIETKRVIAVAAVGAEPRHITVTPDQECALVLNRKSGDMAVIRIGALQRRRAKSPSPLFTMIPVGSCPVSAAVQRVG